MEWNKSLARPWTRTVVDTTQGAVYNVRSATRLQVFAIGLPPDPADQATVIRLLDNLIKQVNDKAPGE